MSQDYEHLKLCAARRIYRRSSEIAPKSRLRWSDWFENKFGENYFEYVERMKK